MPNPNAPRPPSIDELVCLPDPEGEDDEKPEPLFVPDPDLADWVREHLFGAESPLLIETHVDIMGASIGFVWTNAENKRQGKQAGGTAQLGKPGNSVKDGWNRAALEFQRREWFGTVPDLLVHLWAPYCARCEGYQLVALIDHEISHFAQALDKHGEPRFDEETDAPIYAIVGHDLEEFVDVVHRWGDWDRSVSRMKGALSHKPYMDRELADRLVGPPTVIGW